MVGWAGFPLPSQVAALLATEAVAWGRAAAPALVAVRAWRSAGRRPEAEAPAVRAGLVVSAVLLPAVLAAWARAAG